MPEPLLSGPHMDFQRMERKWKIGIPADCWLGEEELIGKFITANKLKAAGKVAAGVAKSTAKAISIDNIIDPRGGRKTPHLHFKGDIYLLDAKQWREFSTPVLKEMSARLAAVRSIPFESFIEVSQAVLPHQ